jgi:hypothetical protein
MVYFLGAFCGINRILVLDLEIGERKYIKTIIFSLKYVASHIFIPMENINIYDTLELICYLSCEILFIYNFHMKYYLRNE